jgi:TP901 family phage tail tape measure protein
MALVHTIAFELDVNGAIPPGQRLRDSLRGVGRQSEQTQSSVSNLVSSVKSLIPAIGGLALIKSSISTIREFEKSLSSLSSITGASAEDLKFYSEAAKEFGKTTQFSASQAVDALKLVASAKPDLLTSRDNLAAVTEKVVTLASAANMELAPATEALTQSLNMFGVGAEKAGEFMNVLAAGSKFGSSTIPETAAAMRNLGTVAKMVGMSYEQTNAAIQVFHKEGIPAESAGFKLSAVLLRLSTAADQSLNPKLHGLTTVLKRLKERGIDENIKAAKKLFGQFQVGAGVKLIQNRELLEKLTERLTGTSVAFEQAAINADNLDSDILSLGSRWEGLLITLGEKFLPITRETVRGLSSITTGLTLMAAVLPEITIEPLLRGFDLFVAGFSSSTMSMRRSLAGIRDAFHPITTIIDNLTDHVQDITPSTNAVFLNLASTIHFLGTVLGEVVSFGLSLFADKIKELSPHIINLSSSIHQFGRNTLNIFADIVDSFKGVSFLEGFNNAIQDLTSFIESIDWRTTGEIIANGIADGISFLWDTIKSFFVDVPDKINTMPWVETGKNIMNLLFTGIKAGGQALAGYYTTHFENIKEKVLSIDWGKLGGDVVNFLGEGVSSASAFLKETFVSLFEQIDINTIDWSALGASIGQLVGQGLGKAYNFITGFYTDLYDKLTSGIANINFQDVGIRIGELFVQGLKATVQLVISFAGNLLGVFFGEVSKSEKGAETAGTALINALGSAIGGGVDLLAGIVVGVVHEAIVVPLANVGEKIITTLTDGIKEHSDDFKLVVKNLFADARKLMPFSDAQEGPFSDLTASGGALVTTFSEGILSKGDVLKNTLSGVFGSAMEFVQKQAKPQTFADKLQFKFQKSKNIVKWGNFINSVSLKAAEGQKILADAMEKTKKGTDNLIKQSPVAKKASKDVQKLLAALRKQRDTIGMDAKELDIYNLKQLKAGEPALKKAIKLHKEIADAKLLEQGTKLTNKLKEEKEMLGLTSVELATYKAEKMGIVGPALKAIELAAKELEVRKNQHKDVRYLHNLQQELDLLKLTGSAREEEILLRKLSQDATGKQIERVKDLNKQIANQKLVNKAAKDMQKSYETAFKNIDNAASKFLDRLIDGTGSLKDNLKGFGKDILKGFAKQATTGLSQQLFSGVQKGVGSLLSGSGNFLSGIGSKIAGFFGGSSSGSIPAPVVSAPVVQSGSSGTDFGGIIGGVASLAGAFLNKDKGGAGCCGKESPVVKTLRTLQTVAETGNKLAETSNKIQDGLARNVDAGEFGEKGLSLLGARLTGVESLSNIGVNSQAAMLASQTAEFGNFGAEMTREALTGVRNTSNIFTDAASKVKDAFKPATDLWESASTKVSGMMDSAAKSVNSFISETWTAAKSAVGMADATTTAAQAGAEAGSTFTATAGEYFGYAKAAFTAYQIATGKFENSTQRNVAIIDAIVTTAEPIAGIVKEAAKFISGVGTPWKVEAQGAVLDVKGLENLDLGMWIKKTKKRGFKGRTKEFVRDIDDTEENLAPFRAKFSEATDLLNNLGSNLVDSLTTFQTHISGQWGEENQEWFSERLDDTVGGMVAHGVSRLKIQGVDTFSSIMQNTVNNTVSDVFDGSFNAKTLKSSIKQGLSQLKGAAPETQKGVTNAINEFISKTDFATLNAKETNEVLTTQLHKIFDEFQLDFNWKEWNFVVSDMAKVLTQEINAAHQFLNSSTPIHEQAQGFISSFIENLAIESEEIALQINNELNTAVTSIDFSGMSVEEINNALNQEISTIYERLGLDLSSISNQLEGAYLTGTDLVNDTDLFNNAASLWKDKLEESRSIWNETLGEVEGNDELYNEILGNVQKFTNQFTRSDAILEGAVGQFAKLGDGFSQLAVNIFEAQQGISSVITDDIDFFVDLRNKVMSFEGDKSELPGFVQGLIDAHNLIISQRPATIEDVEIEEGGFSLQPFVDNLIAHVNEIDYSGIKITHIANNLSNILNDSLIEAGQKIPIEAFNSIVDSVTSMTAQSLREKEAAPVSQDLAFFQMLQEHARSFTAETEKAMEEAKFNEEELQAEREKSAQTLKEFTDGMIAVRQSFRNLGFDVNTLNAEVVGSSGGIQQLTQNAALFSETFGNQRNAATFIMEEQLLSLNSVIWELGLSLPETKEGFINLVKELDKTDEAQAQIFNTILSNTQAFSDFYNVMENLNAIAMESNERQLIASQESRNSLQEVFDSLNQSIPTTRNEFGILIESIDITTQAGREMALTLGTVSGQIDEMFLALNQVFNIDAGSFANSILDAVYNSESATQAGDTLAANFTQTFYDGMIGSVMQSVAQTVMQGVVNPFLQSSAMAGSAITSGGAMAGNQMATGASAASGALATGGSLAANALASAVGQVEMMVELLRSEEMQSALGEMQDVMKTLGGDTFTAMQPIMQAMPTMQVQSAVMTESINDMGRGAESFSEAIEEVADSLRDEANSLLDYVTDLNLGDTSTLENSEQLATAQNLYMTTLAKAQKGDAEAFASMQDVADTYRNLSKDFFGDSERFVEADENIRQDLTALAAGELGLDTEGVALRLGEMAEAPEVQVIPGSDTASQWEAVQRRLEKLEGLLEEAKKTNELLSEQLTRNDNNAKEQVSTIKTSANVNNNIKRGEALAEVYA